MQRPPRLAQGQVQRRAVKGPAAVQTRDLADRGDREQIERVDPLAELAQGVVAGQVVHGPGRLPGDVILGVVDDVLAEPLLAAAA